MSIHNNTFALAGDDTASPGNQVREHRTPNDITLEDMSWEDRSGEDKFKEECAVFGVIGLPEAANYCYLALYAMQHRGQEGAGIVSSDGNFMYVQRDMGLVADVFTPQALLDLKGSSAIGHTRYATCGSKERQNLQPLVANFQESSFAIAHNGNLVNAQEIRKSLEDDGAIFSTTSDTEVILHLTARCQRDLPIRERLIEAVKQVKGAFSLVVLTAEKMIAIRDPYGVRPLSLGKIDNSYVVASETCSFDLIGAQFIRDISPGEIIEITSSGEISSTIYASAPEHALCVFEYIYFARPDSQIGGKNVYQVRKNLGKILAIEQPAPCADLVIPVPDSGVPAALGYAEQTGLPLEFGLIRNHYVGRTFIEPKQSIRDFGVKIKLNPNPMILQDKRLVVVDDSIVRGTTCKKIVTMLRNAGAKEVHFRISSPPTTGPCHYGIDTPTQQELIAWNYSVDAICKYIGADSLGYLSSKGLYEAINAEQKNYCDACFTRNYRLGVPSSSSKDANSKNGNNVQSNDNPKKSIETRRLALS